MRFKNQTRKKFEWGLKIKHAHVEEILLFTSNGSEIETTSDERMARVLEYEYMDDGLPVTGYWVSWDWIMLPINNQTAREFNAFSCFKHQ